MSRRASLLTFLFFGWGATALLFAQTAVKPNISSPSPIPSVAPQPSSTPTTKSLVDSMDSTDLKEAIQLLKNNYIKPQALNETELNRATFEGILTRPGTRSDSPRRHRGRAARTGDSVFRRDSGGSHRLSPVRSPGASEPRGAGRAPANSWAKKVDAASHRPAGQSRHE